jgi:hypothetical protein
MARWGALCIKNLPAGFCLVGGAGRREDGGGGGGWGYVGGWAGSWLGGTLAFLGGAMVGGGWWDVCGRGVRGCLGEA